MWTALDRMARHGHHAATRLPLRAGRQALRCWAQVWWATRRARAGADPAEHGVAALGAPACPAAALEAAGLTRSVIAERTGAALSSITRIGAPATRPSR